MDTFAAENLVNSLMEQHGLKNNGWLFRWSNAKHALGTCIYAYKQIKLSIHYVTDSDEQKVRDTILHEIAHALVGGGHGHNYIWRRKCMEIGATPRRVSKTYNVPQGKYVATCPIHGILGYYYRQISTNVTRRCRKCHSIVEIKLNENIMAI